MYRIAEFCLARSANINFTFSAQFIANISLSCICLYLIIVSLFLARQYDKYLSLCLTDVYLFRFIRRYKSSIFRT